MRYEGSQVSRSRVNTVVDRPPPPQMPGMDDFDVRSERERERGGEREREREREILIPVYSFWVVVKANLV